MIKNEGVSVNLPSATTSAAEVRKSSTTVTVTENGDIYLDKEILNIEGLKRELRKLKAENPDLKVFINGDEKADFGKGIEVLDEVRSIGIKKVAIQTKRKQS